MTYEIKFKTCFKNLKHSRTFLSLIYSYNSKFFFILIILNLVIIIYFLDVNNLCPGVINENELDSILDYRTQVRGICEVLTRDQMKVAFFGRFV